MLNPDVVKRQQRKAVAKLFALSLCVFLMSLWGVVETKTRAAALKPIPPPEPVPAPADQEVITTASPGSHTAVPKPRAIAGATGGPYSAEVMQATMSGLEPAIADCLTRWWMLEPALASEVQLQFRVGPEGLEDARVLDHAGVPDGPMDCLGEAIYATRWPVSPTPQQISRPFPLFTN